MLNPKLFLNGKIFAEDILKIPTRDGYGEGLLELGEKNPNVVVLTADLSESTRCDKFQEKYPERFFECGIAEQNMAAIAAGLAVSGKIPFISSYAVFSPGKNWETIRTTIIYNQANVKLAGHHSGIVTGPDGSTHQATEDLAITRAWPGIKVVVPCDSHQAKKATIKAGSIDGPVYLRFTREKTPVITSPDTPFEIGKADVYWLSDKPKITLFATGHMLYYALLAAYGLEQENIASLVVNVASLKPLDEENILTSIQESQKAISIEDHQVTGGLGGALAELFAKTKPIPMGFIGLQDTFAESGSPAELIEKYNMGVNSIKEKTKKLLSLS